MTYPLLNASLQTWQTPQKRIGRRCKDHFQKRQIYSWRPPWSLHGKGNGKRIQSTPSNQRLRRAVWNHAHKLEDGKKKQIWKLTIYDGIKDEYKGYSTTLRGGAFNLTYTGKEKCAAISYVPNRKATVRHDIEEGETGQKAPIISLDIDLSVGRFKICSKHLNIHCQAMKTTKLKRFDHQRWSRSNVGLCSKRKRRGKKWYAAVTED